MPGSLENKLRKFISQYWSCHLIEQSVAGDSNTDGMGGSWGGGGYRYLDVLVTSRRLQAAERAIFDRNENDQVCYIMSNRTASQQLEIKL